MKNNFEMDIDKVGITLVGLIIGVIAYWVEPYVHTDIPVSFFIWSVGAFLGSLLLMLFVNEKPPKIALLVSLGIALAVLLRIIYDTISSAQSKSMKQENSFVGEWFALNTSNGGLGAGYTFNKDGKFTNILGAYVAFKYKLEGDTLIMIIPGVGEQKTKVEINSTKLIFINNDRNAKLTRIAGDKNAGIIGKWSGVHDTGSKQIIDFTASKDMYLSVPMTTRQGTYEIKGDIVELLEETNSSYQWSVMGDILTLNAIADEKSLKYVRMK